MEEANSGYRGTLLSGEKIAGILESEGFIQQAPMSAMRGSRTRILSQFHTWRPICSERDAENEKSRVIV
jgi:hypothetical protein